MGERLKRLKDNLRLKAGTATLVEVYGTRELLVTGCTGIVDFNENEVSVDTVDGRVTLLGSALTISAYRADLLAVNGCIEKLVFGG